MNATAFSSHLVFQIDKTATRGMMTSVMLVAAAAITTKTVYT